ncbi:hypothetical protein BJ508DRAFT_19068 [Ascobolus immersus RN42]|uniref:Disintegrin domain-containing protein n=1 Tax=Ascobolus immersus RN42 TaxID=1160509 RepID=A0A3N4HNY0_ASCIM|nr:hypothetical protein BJ508DRAFT_19068 [Ascobolus immersus RN42]
MIIRMAFHGQSINFLFLSDSKAFIPSISKTFLSSNFWRLSTGEQTEAMDIYQKRLGFFYSGGSLIRRSVCGNGIVEPGEDCDCDRESGKCDNLLLFGCCNLSTCKFVPFAEDCRKAKGECDKADYCLGNSPTCNWDEFWRDGLPCKAPAGSKGNFECKSGICVQAAKDDTDTSSTSTPSTKTTKTTTTPTPQPSVPKASAPSEKPNEPTPSAAPPPPPAPSPPQPPTPSVSSSPEAPKQDPSAETPSPPSPTPTSETSPEDPSAKSPDSKPDDVPEPDQPDSSSNSIAPENPSKPPTITSSSTIPLTNPTSNPTSSTTTSLSTSNSSSSGYSKSTVIGAGVGAGLGALLIAIIAVIFILKWKNNKAGALEKPPILERAELEDTGRSEMGGGKDFKGVGFIHGGLGELDAEGAAIHEMSSPAS